MRKLLVSVSAFSLISFPVFSASHKGGAELLNPKAYSISSALSILNTSAYLDYEGADVEMPAGSTYSLMDFDFGLSYGLSRNVEVTGLARIRRVSSTINDTAIENSGIESIGVLGKYAFKPIGKTRYAVGIYYRQTLYTNKKYENFTVPPSDELILGDDGSEYGVNLYLTHSSSKQLKWDGLFGYRSPGTDLSSELIYKLEGIYFLSKFGIYAGIEGIFSMKNDEFSDTPLLKPAVAIGSTRQFNSINREKMAPYIGGNYDFGKFSVGAKVQTIMAGQSTDKGTLLAFNVDWSTSGVTRESVKVESFKEYLVDGSVLKLSARGNFLKIDQGLSTDVEKGMKFDIYQTDYFGGNVLVASGVVYDAGADWSVIKITKTFKEIAIKPGFAARGY
jgi:hypothetical protein